MLSTVHVLIFSISSLFYVKNYNDFVIVCISSPSNKYNALKLLLLPGFANEKVPFVIGIGIGVMFTLLPNNTEVQNLNKLLKETQSLVQELHEELEMKEQLNVKEVADEGCKSQRSNELPLPTETPNTLNQEQDLGKSTKFGDEELDYHKAERCEAMSKIEAELEAELERLELNIRASSLQRIPLCVEVSELLNFLFLFKRHKKLGS